MKSIFVLIALVSTGSSSFAENKVAGAGLLKKLNTETKAQVISIKSLPQNVGGNAAKLAIDDADKLTQKTIEIAISDEAVFQDVIKTVIEPLEDSFLNKKILTELFSKNSTQYSFVLKQGADNKIFDEIALRKWSTVAKNQSLTELAESFNSYLSEFKNIEFLELSPYSIKMPISSRSLSSFQPNHFAVDIRADMRGIDSKGQRRQDRFELSLSVEKNQTTKLWLASAFNLKSGETITTANSSFKEVKSFADVEPSNYLRREAIRRGGYALSMCDYNRDGKVDMLVGHLGSVEVFKGLGDGHFKKVSNASLGLENETLVKSIACNDFDNDGLKDLLFVRFAPSDQKGNDLILYHNTGEKFVKETTIRNRQPAYYAMPSAVADYNSDGLLDFYIGFPGAKDFTVLNKKANGFSGLKEAHPQGLFYNLGKFSFDEVTKQRIPYTKTKNAYTDGYPEVAAIFPHTSAGIDYNLDGNMDIVVIDDKANLSPLYKNTGNGNFLQVADKIGITNYDFGMGFAAADLDNDGYLEFIYTNVNFLPSERLSNSLVNNFSEYSRLPGTYGVRIFKTKDGKNYSDITAISGITSFGYGVGGVEIIDYNNDGYQDFYVPNGLWSGSTKKQDISSLFTRAYSKFDLDYEEVMGSPNGIEQANTSFMKILTDFKGDVTTEVANESLYPSMTGFQRNRLFRNNGDGTYTDVAYMLGVDSISDGYIATTADLNSDGKMDLILRNADPGTDQNRFASMQVFMNENKSKNKSVILTLEGARSNRDAVGVIVEAQIDEKKLVRHLIANNGAAQSEPLLHFGLGKKNKIDSLKIRWPSGVVDLYKNIPAGKHYYKESSLNITATVGN